MQTPARSPLQDRPRLNRAAGPQAMVVPTLSNLGVDKEKLTMLRLAVIFIVIALIAAFFGFGGVASFSWEGAKILVFVFLALAVLSFLAGMFRRTSA